MRCLHRLAACLIALALSATADAASYYVANNGDDARPGTSAEAPWRTLAKARESVAAGDTVLLRRGDVFRESADFSSAKAQDLTFGAYGPQDAPQARVAPQPVISGGVPVAGWKPYREGIYVATVEVPIEHLFVDGKLMKIARYPNEGWLHVIDWGPADDGKDTYITCPELTQNPRNAPDYWKGAQMRWRRWSWWHETRRVLADDGKGRLVLEGPPGQYDPFWTGIYMDDRLDELDAPGEWYFDPETKQVYLYPPGGRDPSGLSIEGSHLEQGLSVISATVEDITFRHQTQLGLGIQGKSTVRGCRFEGINGAALQATWGAGNTVVSGCTFAGSINNAITWNEDPQDGASSLIEGNTFTDTGMVPAYEARQAWHAVAICLYNGTNVRIRNNVIDGTGYSGMYIGGDANIIECNRISRALWTMNDGGGIYVNASRNVIRHNIVLDSRGNEESSQRIPYGNTRDYEHSWPWANLGQGIWIEFLGDFGGSIVEANTCAGCGGFGLFLPNNFEDQVRDNVLYNNARAQLEISGFESYDRTDRKDNLPQGHTITGNVLYAAEPGQAVLLFQPQFDYGFMAANYLCAPFSDAPLRVTGVGEHRYEQSPLSIVQWQEKFSWADRAPRTDLTRPEKDAKPADFSRLLTNDSAERRDVPLGEGIYHDLDGRILTGAINLAPFSSAVLVRCRPPELVPAERQAPAAGRLSWVAVAAERATKWTAQSDADWIVVIRGKGEGQGIGAVRYMVLPNRDAGPRTGTLTIAGRTHTIVQAGAGGAPAAP